MYSTKKMIKILTYAIFFIALISEVVLERGFPLITLGYLSVHTGLLLLNIFLNEKLKVLNFVIPNIRNIIVYVLILHASFIAIVYLGYSTTPHTFIWVMIILLSLNTLGLIACQIYNIHKYVRSN